MLFSVGCDVEEIDRFVKKSQDRFFLDRIYTEIEQKYCLEKAHPEKHLAVRFCAKEAVVKALCGLNIKDVDYKLIEIENLEDGYPLVRVFDKRCENVQIKISLSHCKSVACANALAVIEKKGNAKNGYVG